MKPIAYFLSEDTLKERTVVSSNVDTKLLHQTIWDCQERCIQPILGTPLYNRLQDGITNDSLKDEEKDLLANYITNTLLFYVLSELPMVLGYKFYNKNILKKTAENADAATMSEIADLMKYYRNKAEFYEERTIHYLRHEYNNGKFPEYKECYDLHPRKHGYQCSIVL